MEHNSHGDFLSTSQQTQNELTHLSTEPQHQNAIPRNVFMLHALRVQGDNAAMTP